MINSFACKETENIFEGKRSRKFPPDILTRARRKLIQLHNAQSIKDMRVPPSNRLESLAGDLEDYWSIRINQQWRLVFSWKESNADEVKIVDCH